MGDFFVPQGGGFTPPPEPDIEPPDLFALGQNVAQGLDKSGFIGNFLNGLKDILVAVVGGAVGLLLRIAGSLLAFIIRNINAADEVAGPAYAELVAQELSGLFGVSVNAASIQGVGNSKSRAQLGDQVGAFMLQNLLAPSSPASGSGVEPSDSAAKKFLGAVMTMEVEGWFHGWFFDAISYHELEKFGELKDGIARTLGLGRMSRQVFAPPLKVFVHDPYMAKLNDAYRPEHLPANSAIRQYFRGELSRQQLSTILGRQGWREQYIEYLISEHQKYLSDADVDYLLSRGAWSHEQGVHYLAEQGWDTATAERRLAIMHDQRIDHYRREIVAAGQAAYLAGEIPATQLQTIVQASGLSDDEQTWIIRVAGVRRELHATHLGRGDIERLIKEHVMNFGDLQQWAIRNQMPIDEERLLELGILVDETKASAAAKARAEAAAAKAAATAAKASAAGVKAAEAKAQAPDKGISVSEAETLVMDGIWTFDHLTTFLQARGYSASAIDAIEHLLHVKIDKVAGNQAPAQGTRAAAAAKGLNLATMERAVIEGILGISDLQHYLHGHGFTDADSAVIVELTQHAIDAQRVKDEAKAAAEARAGKHSISLPEIERAVRMKLTPIATYSDALKAAHFDQMSIDLLVGILKAQMDADAAAAAMRSAAAASAGKRGISLPQLEQEIIAGIRPIGDYTSVLATLGYDPHDQADLTKLLQLRVDQAASTARQKIAAGATPTGRGLSIGDVERAAKLQIVPVSAYTDALTAAGFDQHSRDVLTAELKAAIAAAAKAQQSTNQVGKALKSAGISLADEQRAVLAGVKPIADYSAMLTKAGYPASDVATLTALLSLKLEQQQAAAERHADAVGAATVRGISIADEERAVLAEDKTMEDYDALLAALGYDLVDRATLENLLQSKIDAANAKKGPA